MDIRAVSIKRVLDILLSSRQISTNEYGEIYSKYIDETGPTIILREQGNKTDSNKLNECLIECGIDISMLFSMLDNTDDRMIRHHKLNEAIIGSLKLELSKNKDRLDIIEKTLKNNNKKIYTETFRDISSFEKEASDYIFEEVTFDPGLEAIKLPLTSSINTLLSNTGNHMGKISIIRQHSGGMKLYNKGTEVINAIDSDISSYWHESIVVDEPIEIPYETVYEKGILSSIPNGAVCELLITMDHISEFNEIYMIPFCEFPIQVIEISYSDNDQDDYIDFKPLVYKTNVNYTSTNKYMTLRNISNNTSYQFDSIRAKRVKIITNQLHYIPNNFITKSENLKANGIFITDDKASFIDGIVEPMNKAITSGSFIIPIEKQKFQADKIQYEYGIYHIAFNNNEYNKTGEYISTPYSFEKSSLITLETNEEHYTELKNGIEVQPTSIEYELIVNGNSIPIVPYGMFHIKWELLNPVMNDDGEYIATLRFNADISRATNIQVFKDDAPIFIGGYLPISQNQVRIIDYNPYANYCISYVLRNPLQSMQYRIADNDVEVKVRAILRRNSRLYTCVTPIIYDYTLSVIDKPLDVGEQNVLRSLRFIPDSAEIYNGAEIDIKKKSEPVLMELFMLIGQDIQLYPDDVLELDEIDDMGGE